MFSKLDIAFIFAGILLVIAIYVMLVPRAPCETFVSPPPKLSSIQYYRNAAGNLCTFEKDMYTNKDLLFDTTSTLLMQRCYQFNDTINNIYANSMKYTGSSYTTKFTMLTNNFADIIGKVTDDIKQFPVQPIEGNVYVLLFQVPNVKDVEGVNMYIQSFQIPQVYKDTADAITHYSPYIADKGQTLIGPVFYVGVIIYDRYDINKKLQTPVSAFSETNMKRLDTTNVSSAPQCFISGVGTGAVRTPDNTPNTNDPSEQSINDHYIAGCASADTGTDDAFKSPYARCYLPPFSKTKQDSAWSYGVLYKINNTKHMAAPYVKTYFDALPVQQQEEMKCVIGAQYSVLGVGMDGNTYYMDSPGSWLQVDTPNDPNIVSMLYARSYKQFFGVGKDNQIYVKDNLQSTTAWRLFGYNKKVKHILFFKIWRNDYLITVDVDGNPKWFGWYTFPNNTVTLQTISRANNGDFIGVSGDGTLYTRGGQWTLQPSSVKFHQVIQFPDDTYMGIDQEGQVYTNKSKKMESWEWTPIQSNEPTPKLVSICVYTP